MEYTLKRIGVGLLAVSPMILSTAYAASAGGGGLPWDAPLTTVQTDLSGPTASAVSLIAIVGVFGVLIFGGELNHFMRTLVYIILGISTLVAGNTLFSALGITGATVEGGETTYALILAFFAGAATTGLWHLGWRLRRMYKRAKDLHGEAAAQQIAD